MGIIKNATTIQSLQIGLNIVDVVAKQGKAMKFTEIQELTQITKSNLYKYLNTLTQLGILYRDQLSGTYVLGSKLIEYGMVAVNQEDVLGRVQAYLNELNKELEETVLFSTWTNNGPMVVKVISNVYSLKYIGAQVGAYLPYFSSTGKVCAAFVDPYMAEEWKMQYYRQITAEQRQKLDEEVSIVKQEKLAYTSEPVLPSVYSIAFPILNFNQELLGCVTILGSSEFLSSHQDHEKIDYITAKRKEISEIFGYRGD